MVNYEQKGILAPFTIITSIFTGILFPILGSYLAINLEIISKPYTEGLILVIIGGFTAQWLLAHTIHDLYHTKIEKRNTLSQKSLKLLLIFSLIILGAITIYLMTYRGWIIGVFALIGLVVSLYAEGLIHHESQMAFGAMFLVIGSFYVQVGTFNLPLLTWLRVVCMGLFAFFSQYGWILFYRLDDYKFGKKIKNRSILITKTGLIFLVLYFLL